MANVLDLRRRIRSVKNTRQITKAMKMVSAAKLRRAQERAMQARPYAQMLTNVLESLVRRTDLYNEQTGEIMHPLLVEREEKNVLVIVSPATRALPAASTRTSARPRRSSSTSAGQGQNIDLEPIGKKAIGFYKKRFPAASTRRRKSTTTTISPSTIETSVIARSRSKLRRAPDAAGEADFRRRDEMAHSSSSATSAPRSIPSTSSTTSSSRSSRSALSSRSCCRSASWVRTRSRRSKR
jgi:F-type H+-transporting ATPase subunit gamma